MNIFYNLGPSGVTVQLNMHLEFVFCVVEGKIMSYKVNEGEWERFHGK